MSKRTLYHAAILVALGSLVYVGCQEDATSPPPLGSAAVAGRVSDLLTGDPLPDVAVESQGPSSDYNKTATTDGSGFFRLDFENVDSSAQIILAFLKTGFRDTAVDVTLGSGQTAGVNMIMTPRSIVTPPGGGGGSGVAQTIHFLGAEPREVDVYGVGGEETAILGWEVRDSLGLPIDASHAVTLTFLVVGGVNGGEYISPSSVQTNSAGQVFTTFNSGIRSGVVQVIARTTVGTRTITSSPVRVIIRAGFPDQTHFSVAPSKVNFGGAMHVNNLRDGIAVVVGDVYSNPVAANTAVYMNAQAGVIVASIFTSATGEGEADLISGNPRPLGAFSSLRNGIHTVYATTIGQGGTIVRDSTYVLWSGFTQFPIFTPSSINVPHTGSQAIQFTVMDEYGNPLAQGTTITVSGEGPQARVFFGESGQFVMPDTRSLGYTLFTLVVADSRPDTNFVSPVVVTVSIRSAANGNATAGVSGIVR